MKKWMKMSGSILYALVFTMMIVCIIVVLSSRTTGGDPQIFGYEFKQVLSGSMEPEFSTGSLIVVKHVTSPETLKKGDIITFQTKQDQSFVTHRIVGVKGKGVNKAFETKGDHNMYQDGTLVKANQVTAQYTGVNIPYAGKLLSYAGTSAGTALLLIIPGVMLLVYSTIHFVGAAKHQRHTAELHMSEEQA
ncbi:signal peptidase I W [Bacillus altitudinis]|uniref:signal peptidase I SipW n=1 Tax=Bacillus altitudinis TaxID=293387 RepID=UPI000C24E84A|nr:signal peptidase I [Bacillus altitudinis]PJI11860.1 signal peptidase I [Bacillus altitudinis]PKQ85315.1 signal peptidase I [Bacillus altitudinis]GJI58443.1 signal peptidase I W [Bacillus altitudinis]